MFLAHRSVDNRSPISREAIQTAIMEAIKKADPACEPFVGVIVQHTDARLRAEPNWAIRGIKFGRADRNKASDALAIIVERMQREFNLSED